MDWNKAKNLIIILLIVLNMFIFLLLSRTKVSYELTLTDEKNILNILREKNIAVYTELPTQFYPMKDLEVISYGRDGLNDLANLIFSENVVPFVEKDKITYQEGTMTLVIQNGFFSLYSQEGIPFTKEELIGAVDKSDKFIKDKEYKNNDLQIYEYREMYSNHIVYSNYFEIEVENNVIKNFKGYNSEVSGFIGEKKEIVSVDMVLFNFIKEIDKIYENKEIIINNIDIVYYQSETTNEENIMLKGIPCYRIEVVGNNVPFLIDAYTNEIIN